MSAAIRAIQAQLKVDNYYKGSIDGLHGRKSQEALREAIDSGKFKLYFNYNLFKIMFKRPKLSQSFVDSVNGLFQVFNEYNNIDATNPNYIAYMLGTSYLETDTSMAAIKEYGGANYFSKYGRGTLAKQLGNRNVADGIKYAGRGHVMITGRDNYQKFSTILGIDLISNPDLALNPVVSAKILTIGCIHGVFTTKKLGDYIRLGNRTEFRNARRVVNGTDRASDIAIHAEKFLECVILIKTV